MRFPRISGALVATIFQYLLLYHAGRDGAGWTGRLAFSTADTFGTVGLFVDCDTHAAGFAAESTFGTFCFINLIVVEGEAIEDAVDGS